MSYLYSCACCHLCYVGYKPSTLTCTYLKSYAPHKYVPLSIGSTLLSNAVRCSLSSHLCNAALTLLVGFFDVVVILRLPCWLGLTCWLGSVFEDVDLIKTMLNYPSQLLHLTSCAISQFAGCIALVPRQLLSCDVQMLMAACLPPGIRSMLMKCSGW